MPLAITRWPTIPRELPRQWRAMREPSQEPAIMGRLTSTAACASWAGSQASRSTSQILK